MNTTQTLEPKWNYEKHSKHISFGTKLRICKYCGELYYNITEDFIHPRTGKTITRNTYDMSQNKGGSPFLNHLETHEVEN